MVFDLPSAAGAFAARAAAIEALMLHRADAACGRPQPGAAQAETAARRRGAGGGPCRGRGRHLGRLGSLRERTDQGVEFLIGTGFSDAERKRPPPLGAFVTYTCRGTTTAGVPRLASYLRLREDV